MSVLFIDNYDSFVYNLVRYIEELGFKTQIYRNDAFDLTTIKEMQPERIIISPGPKSPEEAGLSNRVIQEFYKDIPILGICLGYQCIGHVFGASCRKAQRPHHGKTSWITHNGQGLFKGLPNPLQVTRYHSLALYDLPDCFEITARCEEIMGIQHRLYPLSGVQFHPEAVLSEYGHAFLKNFLSPSYSL